MMTRKTSERVTTSVSSRACSNMVDYKVVVVVVVVVVVIVLVVVMLVLNASPKDLVVRLTIHPLVLKLS